MPLRSFTYRSCALAAALLIGSAALADDALVFDLRPETHTATVVMAPPRPKAQPAAKQAPKPAPKPAVKPPAPKKTRVASAALERGTMVGRLGTVAYNNVPIYDGPHMRKIYNYCPAGQMVLLTGWNNQWYGVRMIDGRTGYIYRGYVQLMDATLRIPEVQPRSYGQGYALVGVMPLLQTAFQYMGIPYKWGGTSVNGIDCSGFVRSVYSKYGVHLPRVARDQAKVGLPIPTTPEALRPGDRLYFACHHRYIDHTGIYWGNGLFIHSSGGRGVDITPLWDNGIYERGLVAARRTFATG